MLSLRMITPWMDKYVEAFNSNLALDKSQLKQRADKVIDEAADALLADGGASTYRRLLEETALVLHVSGDDETARQALFHAMSLDDAQAPHSNAFLRALTARTIFVLIALYARDQDGADVDEHRRRAGVDAALGRVEGNVVDAEPGDAADQQPWPVLSARPVRRSCRQHRAQHQAADQQPAERQRAGREVVAEVADRHEGGGPEDDGHERGRPRQQPARRGDGLGRRGGGSGGGAHGVRLGRSSDSAWREMDVALGNNAATRVGA